MASNREDETRRNIVPPRTHKTQRQIWLESGVSLNETEQPRISVEPILASRIRLRPTAWAQKQASLLFQPSYFSRA